MTRGGAVNGPAAVYALTKYVDWMKQYAPPFAASMTWSEAGPVPARGNIAQRVFQYITWLSDDAWKGYGALAGSWIGGTANMAATAEMLGTSEEQFGLAVIADNVIYVVWLPLLLMSRDFADRFNKWARVPAERLEAMDAAADLHVEDEQTPTMPQYLFLTATAIGVTWFATALAPSIAGWVASVSAGAASVFSVTTVRILLVTTIALLLSVTPASRLPNSFDPDHEFQSSLSAVPQTVQL